jgi:hypothetical protein
MYTILNTSLWRLTFVNLFILTFASSLLDDLKCLPVWQWDKVTCDYIWLNKSVPVPAGTFFHFFSRNLKNWLRCIPSLRIYGKNLLDIVLSNECLVLLRQNHGLWPLGTPVCGIYEGPVPGSKILPSRPIFTSNPVTPPCLIPISHSRLLF